jgi:hypothetical protein
MIMETEAVADPEEDQSPDTGKQATVVPVRYKKYLRFIFNSTLSLY